MKLEKKKKKKKIQWNIEKNIVIYVMKHLQIDKLLALNNPWLVDMPKIPQFLFTLLLLLHLFIYLSPRHAGHCWRSKEELISDVFLWTPSNMVEQKQDDQLEPPYSSSVWIRDVALKTCQKRWMIGRSGERGLGMSVLAARHDDDDDDNDDDLSPSLFSFLLLQSKVYKRIKFQH